MKKSDKLLIKYKVTLYPLLTIISLIILAGILGSNLLGRINRVRSQIEIVNLDLLLLEDKLSTLQSVQGGILPLSQEVLKALPTSNPALPALAQLKKIASENTIVLDKITIDAQEVAEGEIFSAEISFEAKGQQVDLFEFLQKISSLLPVMNIQSTDMSSTSGVVTARLQLKSFWSPFPKNLPPITESIPPLTSQELAMIERLREFLSPEFIEIVPATKEGEIRTDPFSLQ